jgi:hypothetical protein
MIKTTKDGRTILSGKDYTRFRSQLHEQSYGLCTQCHRRTLLTSPLDYDNSFHTHHKNGRGMGGSKRDDTVHSCEGLCGKCHREEHGQQ